MPHQCCAFNHNRGTTVESQCLNWTVAAWFIYNLFTILHNQITTNITTSDWKKLKTGLETDWKDHIVHQV